MKQQPASRAKSCHTEHGEKRGRSIGDFATEHMQGQECELSDLGDHGEKRGHPIGDVATEQMQGQECEWTELGEEAGLDDAALHLVAARARSWHRRAADGRAAEWADPVYGADAVRRRGRDQAGGQGGGAQAGGG